MLLQMLNAWIATAIQGLLLDDVDAYLTRSVKILTNKITGAISHYP
jgi:hypothetical protein